MNALAHYYNVVHSKPLHEFNNKYDKNGNVEENVITSTTRYFTYDKLDRLLTTQDLDRTHNYQYDSTGNRSTLEHNVTINYQDFDMWQSLDYEYNEQNLLVSTYSNQNGKVFYTYNGNGQLYERHSQHNTTRYYYDGDYIIAEVKVEKGVPVEGKEVQYIRGVNQQLVQRKSGTFLGDRYYLHNIHGDVVSLVDGFGRKAEEYEYNEWGMPTTPVEMETNPFLYSGEYWDPQSQFLYLRARWYDPSIGRFLHEDSYQGEITNPLTLNLYTYSANNPLRYIDPSGHMFIGFDHDAGAGGSGGNYGGHLKPYIKDSYDFVIGGRYRYLNVRRNESCTKDHCTCHSSRSWEVY